MNKIVIAFVDGVFCAEQSDVTALPDTILFCPFNAVVNWMQGAFLYVPKSIEITAPIYIKCISTGKQNVSCYLRNTIVLEDNSHITIVEEYTGAEAENYVMNSSTEFQLGKNARLHFYKLQNENPVATHHSAILIQQQESSHANVFFADCGAKTANVNLRVNLHEKYAACDLSGLYRLNQNAQQVNNYIHIDHAAEHGMSSMQFKGILDNQSSAGFVGKVFVHEKAQHIQAQQANHNLLLSTAAEVKTKPELEIYADDVKCSHGATVGQLDEEALFYLRSRGIEKQAALELLTQAFADDIMNKIEHVAIRHLIQERMI